MRPTDWCNLFAALTLGFALSSSNVSAQSRDPADYLRRLDQNGDGRLEPAELERLPSFVRDRLGQRLDLSRSHRIDDVVDVQRRGFEEMRSTGGGFPAPGGGFPVPGGGFPRPGGSPSGSDRGGDSDRRDGDSRRDSGRGDSSRGGDSGRGDSRSDRTPSVGSKQSETKKKERTPFTARLPEAYASKDTDRDGQIGLYEWSRNDLEGFRKLDRNGDGFLTPRELVATNGTSSTTVASTSPPTTSDRSRSDSSRGDSGRGDSRRGDFGRGDSSRSRDGDSSDRRRSGFGSSDSGSNSQGRAEMSFRFMDGNKDDEISEDEWTRSITVKPMFERAKIEIKLPMKKSDFLAKFAQASASGS